MSLILDAGALIAFERGGRTIQALLERAHREEVDVCTTTGAVAQVWRNASRQVLLGRLLRGIDEKELTRSRARTIGMLLAVANGTDVVDGSIIEIARDGDEIVTTDPDDLVSLAEAAGKTLLVTPI
jgi:hypothetical protein